MSGIELEVAQMNDGTALRIKTFENLDAVLIIKVLFLRKCLHLPRYTELYPHLESTECSYIKGIDHYIEICHPD